MFSVVAPLQGCNHKLKVIFIRIQGDDARITAGTPCMASAFSRSTRGADAVHDIPCGVDPAIAPYNSSLSWLSIQLICFAS